MLPAEWKPRPAGGLIRVGSPGDGGYVVAERAVAATEILVSMGLNDDWTFEADFRARSGARVVCYDPTVDRKFWQLYAVKKLLRLRPVAALHYLAYRRFFRQPGVEHRRLWVGYDSADGVSLDRVMAEFGGKPVFLKIDIEGSEHRILDQIVAHRAALTGLVLEIHDLDLHRDRVARFMAAMTGFTNIFFHANNFAGVDAAGDPIVIEAALMRDDLVDPAAPGTAPPPAPPNNPDAPDIQLVFADAA